MKKVIYQKFKADPEYKRLNNGSKKLIKKEAREDKPIGKPKVCTSLQWPQIEALAIPDDEVIVKINEVEAGKEVDIVNKMMKPEKNDDEEKKTSRQAKTTPK